MRTNSYDQDLPLERQGMVPLSLGKILPAAVEGVTQERIRATQHAARIWAQANGDRERAHTTGVTLVPPRVGASDPRLVVYLDSNVLMSDFRTNTDLYLARLAMRGLALSGLDFRLSRDASRRYHAPAPAGSRLPPLNDARARELDELVRDLPDGLREKARSAAESSLRRNAAT